MLAVGLLIPILIGINAHRTTERMVSQNRLLIHTHLVLQKTQQIQAHLTNLDNDLRGYLLSQNNPFFKADYDRNVGQMAGYLKNITALTIDNPAQQQRLRTISQLFEQKLAHGNILFTKRSPQEGLARLDSVRTFMGFSDQLFHQLKTIEAVENELLTVRATASEQSATYATRSSIAGAVAALAIILWAIFRLLKTLNNATRLNRQLAQNEQQLKRFLEAVPVSIVVVNKDGKLYYANQAAASMFEAITKFDTYADILNQITIYQFPNGNPYPTEKRPAFRAMKGETSQVDDIEIRIGDKAIQVLSSSSPVYDAEGMLQYVVSSSIDISDRVQSQLRLHEAKELAEQAARIKENFLANMSHEIRTPLNAIIGFSNLLEVTPLNEEQAEFVKLVQTAGKNLLTIVNDILDISKIEAGMIQMESIPFSIRSLVASLQTMLQPTAADKNLKLFFDVDPTLPPLVLGDPTRLTQILLNLLSNAIKFTKEGSITAQITRQEETEQSVRVQFKVTDTGIGIEADALPHIFERFRQASNFTTRYYGGTGLGLNIVKSLTQIQGGWITVTSKPGKGSEFTLEIPYQIAPESVRKSIDPDLTKTNAVKKSLTILAVEDNLMNQKLVLQVIKRLGYKAELAENGQQALDMLQKGSFDLILMDIQMPVMDGYQTTRHIRTTLQSNIPIIAMTAHALASEREQCLQAGMNDFLPKPFQMEDLQRMIQHYGFPNGEKAPMVETSHPVQAIDSASFSVEPLLNSVGNDTELAMELLEIYLDKTPDEIKQLQQALSDGDVKAIGRTLHTQKAPGMMMGLKEATELNLQIEALVKADKDITAVEPLLKQYITVVESGLPAIHNALQNGTNQG
ncbi:response regulator [Spirosoma aureum]|uniref:histidine kinase n=1 Tax=Spirosoma aureum TaxID=2692134 RepID=A0A6G9AZX9_9BACT|nr:response regulator [Spirosoma aureum]